LTLSVIVPTLNEEQMVEGLLRQLTGAVHDIIVVDGGSSDGTCAIAARYATVLHSAPSRALQMNAGAAGASGEVLLFLHADVRLGDGSLDAIRAAMRNGAAGGNLDLVFDGGDWIASLFTAINRARRRCGVFYGDSGIFCRRDLFQALGGYRPWPILEDYEFARRLRKAGRLALLDAPILVSDRRWRHGGLFRTLLSWVVIQGLYLAGVSPHRLARWYRAVR
jgi:rSAM/selenodomain-associated transferase 2